MLLNGLKGYKYTFSNELIDNISSLKEKIASLPDGDFKIKMQNDFNKVISDNIELVSNIIQVIDIQKKNICYEYKNMNIDYIETGGLINDKEIILYTKYGVNIIEN